MPILYTHCTEDIWMLLHASIDPSILLDGFVHDPSPGRLSMADSLHLPLHLRPGSAARPRNRQETSSYLLA